MAEPSGIRIRAQVTKLEDLTKTILCLLKVGEGEVLVTTFLVNLTLTARNGACIETKMGKVNRKFQFVRTAELLTQSPTVENYFLLQQCFQELDQIGDTIDKYITKWVINED